ncbi:MAG: hypothetical protein JSW07_21580 [bacterium]|nr:MAG: hypothetical protein JSW07_21580 [bacterium]
MEIYSRIYPNSTEDDVVSGYEKNDKVKAVLTLNYDSFLEAGATQKFNSARFKPKITNEPPARDNQLPVYHIHGYILYWKSKVIKR